MKLAIRSLILLHFTMLSSQDKVVRSPLNVTILPGENATFHCDVTPAITSVWRLHNTNDPSLTDIFSTQSVINAKEERPFLVTAEVMANTYSSALTIVGSKRSNFTGVQCISLPPSLTNIEEHFENISVAFLRVIAPPTPLVGVQILPAQERDILISWSPSFSPFSERVTYHVKVEDSEEVLSSTDTDFTSFHYSTPKEFCSILTVSVHALNRAGGTNTSVQTYEIFARPNIEDIADSFYHEFQLQNGVIKCTITFDPVVGCAAHPVQHYILLLQDTTTANESQIIHSMEPNFSINTSNHIDENSRYTYRVRAVNNINVSSEIEGGIFYTTDVQSAMARVGSDSVLLRCNFLLGSQCRGCHVNLVFGSVTKSHKIARVSGQEYADDLYTFNRTLDDILVFDWESDGSVGNLSVPVEKKVTPEGLEPTPDNKILLPAIIIAAGGVLAISMLMVLIACGYIAVKRKQKRTQKAESPQLHTYNPAPFGVLSVVEPEGQRVVDSPAQERSLATPDHGPESLYSTIPEQVTSDVEGPLYDQLSHFSSQQKSPSTSQSREDGLYSQLGQERLYAVLENQAVSASNKPLSPVEYCEIVPQHVLHVNTSGSSGSATDV